MARGGWLATVTASRAVRLAALVVTCAVFSLAMIRDTVVPFDGIAFEQGDPRDSGQMVWNLWHVADSVLHGKNPFETNRLYYPIGANLAKHTLVSGFVPVTLLVRLLSGDSPLHPIYAFNILVWLSYTLLLLFSYLSLRALGFGVCVSLVPSIGYAFSDFYYLHASHLNLLAGFFMPLCALLVIRLCQAPCHSRAVLTALALASAAYFTEFFVSILFGFATFGLAMLIGKSTRQKIVALFRTLGRRTLVVSLLVFAGVLSPLLFEYARCHTLMPGATDYYSLSANLAGYVLPARQTTWLYGDLLLPLQQKVTTGFSGFEIFLGYPFLLCLIAGLVRPRTGYQAGLLFTGLMFLILSLGPHLKVFNQDLPVPLPYTWLMKVPPFDQNRCPVRFAAVAMFLFVPISAAGLSRILRTLERRLSKASSVVGRPAGVDCPRNLLTGGSHTRPFPYSGQGAGPAQAGPRHVPAVGRETLRAVGAADPARLSHDQWLLGAPFPGRAGLGWRARSGIPRGPVPLRRPSQAKPGGKHPGRRPRGTRQVADPAVEWFQRRRGQALATNFTASSSPRRPSRLV